jgi:hypothetical protein
MAARPGASPVGTVRARRLVHLVAVLAAAATLAAACSGSPQGTEPTATAASTTSGQSPDDSAAAAGDQQSSDGAAGSGGGEAEGSARDGEAEDDATGGDPEDAAAAVSGGASASDGASEQAADGASEQASDGASEQAAEGASEQAAEGAASEQVADEDAVSEAEGDGAETQGGEPEVAVPTDDPELEPFVTGPLAPLTGSLTTDLSLAQRRALAVKIGNGGPKDRPQAGLAAADIVYEVLVEAGFTRFIAVLHSEIPSRVGPVRSARSSDFDILEDLATPYLATSGANSTVRREMSEAARSGTLIDIGASRMSAPYRRDRSRPAPHNLYFHYENLGGGDPDSLPGGIPDTPPEALFEYGSSNSPPLDDAAGVTMAYTELHGGEASHVWDHILGGWVRIQDGILHTTETDFGVAEIAPANVVVLWMSYGRSAADRRSPQAISYGSGQALVLTAGSVHEAVWERTEDRVGYRFTDAAGNSLTLSTGSTWLLLANTSTRWPLAEVTVLTASESAQLLADARAASEA